MRGGTDRRPDDCFLYTESSPLPRAPSPTTPPPHSLRYTLSAPSHLPSALCISYGQKKRARRSSRRRGGAVGRAAALGLRPRNSPHHSLSSIDSVAPQAWTPGGYKHPKRRRRPERALKLHAVTPRRNSTPRFPTSLSRDAHHWQRLPRTTTAKAGCKGCVAAKTAWLQRLPAKAAGKDRLRRAGASCVTRLSRG